MTYDPNDIFSKNDGRLIMVRQLIHLSGRLLLAFLCLFIHTSVALGQSEPAASQIDPMCC